MNDVLSFPAGKRTWVVGIEEKATIIRSAGFVVETFIYKNK